MKKVLRVIVCMVTILFLLAPTGCAVSDLTHVPSPSPPTVALTQLLIDTSALPDSWHIERGPESYSEQQGQENGLYVEFGTPAFEAPIFHIVLQYKDSEYASKKYRQYLPAYFHSVNRSTPWETPTELDYHSKIADQFKFACADFQNADHTSNKYTLCVVMGQYGKYVSIFFTYISQGAMDYADLERVLKVIDERMASFNLESP